MKRWQRAVLGVLVALGGGTVLLRVAAPDQYETIAQEGEKLVADVPEPAVVAAVWLVVVAIFIATMVYFARVLYWSWRQIDRYVLWIVDRLFPESPVVRFGVGLIVMVLVFLIGPLIALQALDFFEDPDPVGDAANESDDENDTSGTDNGSNDTTGNNSENATEGNGTSDGSDEGDPPSTQSG
jgi:hypothetical protein